MVSANPSSNRRGTHPLGRRAGRPGERTHRRRVRTPVTPRAARIFFSCASTQQMKRPGAGDWLAGAAMLLAVAAWGVLVVVLGG